MVFGFGYKAKNIPSYPSAISGCVLHLAADFGITLSSNLTMQVSGWADQSGGGGAGARGGIGVNGFTQTTIANQPIYFSGGGANGAPYLTFTIAGASQMASAQPVTTNTTNWTQFIVVQVLNTAVLNQFIFSTGSGNGFGFEQTSTTRAILETGVGGEVFGTTSSNWEAWANWDTAGVNTTCQVNGVAVSSAGNISPTAATTASTLGSTAGSGAGSGTFNLSEVIVYSRTLATGELASVNNYLQSKYRL
jgi:hypothetical protein